MAGREFCGPLRIDFHSVYAKSSRWHKKGDLSPNDNQLDCIPEPGHAIKWTVEDSSWPHQTISTHKTLQSAVKSMIEAGTNLRIPVCFNMADLYARSLQINIDKEKKDADPV